MLKLDIPPQFADASWVRMPKPKERLLGLSRTTLLELVTAGAIKSVVLRKRHAQRGIRLVFLPSLLEHLEHLHKEQEAGKCVL
jgi:hypothetical protein